MPNNYPLASYFPQNAPLLQPWTTPFNAPTGADESNDPGYGFRLGEGLKARERMAASRGTALTGGTAKGLERYAQDYASGEFDKVYGRALGEYQMANGIYNQNQQNQYNRLSQYAQMGLGAAENMGQTGYNYANLYGDTQMGGAARLGDIYGQQGNSAAAGQAGSANAWSNAAGGVGDDLFSMWMMNRYGYGQPRPGGQSGGGGWWGGQSPYGPYAMNGAYPGQQ